jgi:alpha-D-xyloside xylohydrolase
MEISHMNTRTFLLLLTLAAAASAPAQEYQRTDHGISATVKGKRIELQFFSPTIVRVLKSPTDTPAVKQSLAVIAQPQNVRFTVGTVSYALFIRTDSIQVALDLRNGMFVFSTSGGKTLLLENRSGSVFTPATDAGTATHTVGQSFMLDADEPVYGLGQQQDGSMSRRGARLRMIQGNTDDYVPFFQSVKGYGIYWDNTSPTNFTDSAGAITLTSDVGECIDYYFMYGGNADGVIAQMRELTGQAPMFPLWTFGYWQSKERYKSQFETADVVRQYRKLGVPLDGIIQDWQYWGDNFHWNAMRFLNPQFPEPQKMVDSIHAMNAHIIISVWASFGPQTTQFAEMKDKGMLLNFKTWPPSSKDTWPPDPAFPSGVQVYDPYNPEARDIFWRHLDAGLFSTGIDGWWLDSSEPDHLDFQPSDLDNRTFLGSFRKVRNAFPLMHVGGIYDHQRAASSAKRVFILTRSAFAGQQRYASNVWTGDTFSSWRTLRDQISAGLNLSLSGVPYWNSDIGGFFLGNFPKRLSDPLYRELYVRWMQFGTFCPMMRSHGTDAPREIYQFGTRGEPVFDAIERAIRLRYALLPYIYATSWDVTAHAATMTRPLVMDFPADRKTHAIDNAYMFGRSLLVCPVTQALYQDTLVRGTDTTVALNASRVRTSSVYLPEGTSWTDFWTGKTFKGGQTVQVAAPLDRIPVFARSGAVLVLGPRVQYATEKKWDTLEVRVYPGANGTATLYEDENDNYNYEKGAFSTITLSWNDAKRVLTIGDRTGTFPGILEQRVFRVVRVSAGKGTGIDPVKKPDAMVRYDGKSMKISLNRVH